MQDVIKTLVPLVHHGSDGTKTVNLQGWPLSHVLVLCVEEKRGQRRTQLATIPHSQTSLLVGEGEQNQAEKNVDIGLMLE